MDKCAVFVANYRGLDRYYNFIFAGSKISRDENFAGGKFRAKSKFANIAKISSTRKIGVAVHRFVLAIYARFDNYSTCHRLTTCSNLAVS